MLGDFWMKEHIFSLGSMRGSLPPNRAALQPCHLMTSGGGIRPSLCASVLWAKPPDQVTCSHIPSLLCCQSREAGSKNPLQKPRIKWCMCLTRLSFQKSCLVPSLPVTSDCLEKEKGANMKKHVATTLLSILLLFLNINLLKGK